MLLDTAGASSKGNVALQHMEEFVAMQVLAGDIRQRSKRSSSLFIGELDREAFCTRLGEFSRLDKDMLGRLFPILDIDGSGAVGMAEIEEALMVVAPPLQEEAKV